jgi:two-component system, NtrC family, sensor histidine kinase AtoS
MILKQIRHNFTFRLLLIIFCIISIGFVAIEFSLKTIITNELLKEKEILLFGLTHQLDNALEGTFEEILSDNNARNLNREDKILILNNALKDVTDFVASGVDSVGVGFYSRKLDAIITYGPSDEFQHIVGQSIFEGHQGYEVMESGQSLVQTGELVRGSILNCMKPIIRDNEVIGYIWANETLQFISAQMTKIMNQMFFLLLLTFLLIYIAVVITTGKFIGQVDFIRDGIQKVISKPRHRLPRIQGELNIIVDKINELSESVSYFKSFNRYVLDSVTNGVLALTLQGQIALLNPTFRVYFGMGDTDYRGESMDKIFFEPLISLLKEGLKNDELISYRIFVYKDKILEVHCNRIINEDRKLLGVAFVFRDITLVRQYERQLQERERMVTLGEMGLNVAHEIKNPLTAVKGFTQLMQKRVVTDEQKNRYLVLMNEELERVNGLLNDMLLYGGRFKIIPAHVDFIELLQELLIIYRIAYTHIHFTLDLSDTDVLILNLDKVRITQMLDNLVKNCVDAGSSEVRISLDYERDSVRLSVRDNGEGIPAELIEKIFTPFFTTKVEGSGFGLSLCQEIAGKHGGDLSVESVPGEFTLFSITFNKQLLETFNET